MRLKHLLLLLLLVAVVAGGWVLMRGRPVPVDVAEVTRGTIRAFVEEEGKTRVKERFVISAPVAGRLRRLELDEGDAVAKGTLLAEIDPLALRSRVEETEARIRGMQKRVEGVATKKPKPEELERAVVLENQAREAKAVAERELADARAALVKAEKDLARARRLAKEGTAPEEEVDTAVAAEVHAREGARTAEIQIRIRELEVNSAALNTAILRARLKDFDWEEADYREQVRALEATLQALRDDLVRTRIEAPAAGIVLKLLKESEEVVAAGTPLLEIGDLERLEVEADFLSEDVARMRPGMAAEIFGRALGDAVVPAKIERIYPSAFRKISSLGVEQQRVTVILAAEPGALKLGDRYRVEVRVILDERADALLAPEGAFFRHDGEWCVFKVNAGAARRIAVKTGLRNGTRREISEGLGEGDTVILHPDNAVDDGTRIEALGN